MNDKYIIDGVEYSYGEEVEVRQSVYEGWEQVKLIEPELGNYTTIDEHGNYCSYKYIRKVQPRCEHVEFVMCDKCSPGKCFNAITQPTQTLSGQKAKLTLGDGTELNVTID